MIHDENNTAKIGDEIYIQETRPLSKRKSWIIINKDKAGEK